jgi:hypothetical protein
MKQLNNQNIFQKYFLTMKMFQQQQLDQQQQNYYYNNQLRNVQSQVKFIQTNQNLSNLKINIINNDIYKELLNIIVSNNEDDYLNDCLKYIHTISITYNTDKKNIIKCYLNYIIRYKRHMITSVFLNFVENITHFPECKNQYYVNYSLLRLLDCTPKVPPL